MLSEFRFKNLPVAKSILLSFVVVSVLASCASSGRKTDPEPKFVGSVNRQAVEKRPTNSLTFENVQAKLDFFYQSSNQDSDYKQLIDLLSTHWGPNRRYIGSLYGFLSRYYFIHPDAFGYFQEKQPSFNSKKLVAIIQGTRSGRNIELIDELVDLRFDQSPTLMTWGAYFVDASPEYLADILSWYSKFEVGSEAADYFAFDLRVRVDAHEHIRKAIENSTNPFFRFVLEQPLEKLRSLTAGFQRSYRLENTLAPAE